MINVPEVINSGKTNRYHTHNLVMTQPVSAHSWGVVALILMVHPAPSVALLKAATFHDVGERWVGDTPHTAKAVSPELKVILDRLETKAMTDVGLQMPHLTLEETRWLKWADMAECALHCHRLWVECRYPCAQDVCFTATQYLLNNFADLHPETDALSKWLLEELAF